MDIIKDNLDIHSTISYSTIFVTKQLEILFKLIKRKLNQTCLQFVLSSLTNNQKI